MFSIDSRGMAFIRSFSDAKAYFERMEKPTRSGWQENERPLQHVRKHHIRLRKIDDDTYTCTLYSTDMVTYQRRGSITIHLHDSVSSRKFLDHTLPPGVMCGSHCGDTILHVPTSDECLFLTGNKIVLQKEEGKYGYRLISGAHERVREQLDKDMAKELRAKFKPFLTWWKAANNVVPFGHVKYRPNFENLITQANDRDTWGMLAQCVGTPANFMAYVYDSAGARKLLPIPNTLPFKRGRLSQSS